MKLGGFLAVAAALALTACAPEQPPVSDKVAEYYAQHTKVPEPTEPPDVIAFLGDSYVNGSKNILPTDTYAARAANKLGLPSKPYGAGGIGYGVGNGRGGEPIPTYADDVVADAPDYVVVQGGLNELKKDPAATRTGAAETFRVLRVGLPAAPIVVVGPFVTSTDPAPHALATRDAVAAAAAEAGLPFIDPIAEGWFTGPELLDADGVHLAPEGLNVYADRLTAALTSLQVPTP